MKKAVKKLLGYNSTDPQVFLVATAYNSTINGQIATDVLGLTFLDRWPRVVVFLGKDKYTAELIGKSKVFSISLLSTKQLELVRNFGMFSGRETNKFTNVKFKLSATGSPIISDSVGYADCKVIEQVDLGDHTAFVGLIVKSELLQDDVPLRVSLFLRQAPKSWLVRLAFTTRQSAKAVEKPMKEYARQKGLITR